MFRALIRTVLAKQFRILPLAPDCHSSYMTFHWVIWIKFWSTASSGFITPSSSLPSTTQLIFYNICIYSLSIRCCSQKTFLVSCNTVISWAVISFNVKSSIWCFNTLSFQSEIQIYYSLILTRLHHCHAHINKLSPRMHVQLWWEEYSGISPWKHFCLCWGFMTNSTHWDHVECGLFT